jgi:glutamine amidotransferase
MCELFAMSASAPVDVKLSLSALARHGSANGPHTDGWGVAFLKDKDCMLFRGAEAAYASPWIACLATHPVESATVVAHIRHATQGRISLGNTQPFQRELWGRVHVFAHNGDIAPGDGAGPSVPERYYPIGETDSEAMFCRFLDRLAAHVDTASVSADRVIEAEFARHCRELRNRGPANIIYASGGRVLVHADRRKQASGQIEPPGIWFLERSCAIRMEAQAATSAVSISGSALKVTLVASVPLTDEPWQPLERGTILSLEDGRVAGRIQD